MNAYVINLDQAVSRWELMENTFVDTSVVRERVAGIDGSTLDMKHCAYSETSYALLNGRPTNPMEVGCYLSHIKAMSTFLASEEQHCMICEDDILPCPDFDEILTQVMKFRGEWNIVRLTGLTVGRPMPITALHRQFRLCSSLGRLKGAGAYLIDRKAASVLVKRLLPMRLPYDHAMDREWFYGLRAMYVLPFPISQTKRGLRSQIQNQSKRRFPLLQRACTTYPYQVYNEIGRWIFRSVAWLKARALDR